MPVLLLSAARPPAIGKLVSEGAGYNFGLASLEHPTEVKAGKMLTVPVLVIWASRPGKAAGVSLLDTLKAAKAGLIARLPADALGR